MHFLEIGRKLKIHHISEAEVSFEIQFSLWIKISREHMFYIWQQTIALKDRRRLTVYVSGCRFTCKNRRDHLKL